MLRDYGRQIGNHSLARIVKFLYQAVRADSTRKNYVVGQRHWGRFHYLHPKSLISIRHVSP